MARRPALAGEPRTRYASARSNGQGHFEGSTAKVETDTQCGYSDRCFSTATGFLPPTGPRQRREASSPVLQAGRSGLPSQAAQARQWSGLHPDFQDFMNNGEPTFSPTTDGVSPSPPPACTVLKAAKRVKGESGGGKNWRQYHDGQLPACKGEQRKSLIPAMVVCKGPVFPPCRPGRRVEPFGRPGNNRLFLLQR